MRPSRCFCRYLIPLVSLSFLTTVAFAQREKSGIRRNEVETNVEGSLVDYNRDTIRVKTEEGQTVSIQAGGRTFLQVRAPGSAAFLKEGAIVEVFGTASSENIIEDAQVTVFWDSSKVTSRFGRTYFAQADGPNSIPVVLVAQVLQTDPLVVKASNDVASEFYFESDKGPDGRPIRRHLFPTVGKTFEVKPTADREGNVRVLIDLGDAIQLASAGDRVRATIPNDTGVARNISIYRDTPLTEEELYPGGTKSPTKGTKRKASTKKPAKKAPAKKKLKKDDGAEN